MKGFLKLLVISLCFSSSFTVSNRRRRTTKRENVEPKPKEESFTESVHSKDWIDPHEMVDITSTSYTSHSGACDSKDASNTLKVIQEQLSNCQKELQTYKSQEIIAEETQPCDLPYLKQLVHSLLKATSDVNPHTQITLNPENREMLSRFLEGKSNVHDVTEIIKQNILNKTMTDSLHENFWVKIKEHLTVFDIGNLMLVCFFASLILIVLVFEMRTHLSKRQQFFYLLLVAFVVSIPWEWCRLYKKEFAAKQIMIMKDIEKHCHTDHELGFIESFTLFWKNSFSFQGDKKCKMYQEALLVDPIWEIPPSLAFTVTVTRLLVEPLELVADAFGKSFRALFQHLPIQWQPIMFLACTIIIILCLILLSGVKISTPLFQIGVGVDPAVANASLQRLEYEIQELRQQLTRQNTPHENNFGIQSIPPNNNRVIQNIRPQENNRGVQDILLENHHAVQDIPPENTGAVQGVPPENIQDMPSENKQNVMLAIASLTDTVNAINERTQQQGDMRELLLRLRPVAEQARQAEAIEQNWELVSENQIGAGRSRMPVQATEHHPTET